MGYHEGGPDGVGDMDRFHADREKLYEAHGFVSVRDKDSQLRMENPSEEWKQMETEFLPLRGILMWRPVGGKLL